MPKIQLPLLVGLGPARSGSSWAHELFFGHDEVATTRTKEVTYFGENYWRGPDWYERCFTAVTPRTRLLADISPNYVFVPHLVQQVRETASDPVFLCGLRSPYARTLALLRAFAPLVRKDGPYEIAADVPNLVLFEQRRDVLLKMAILAPTLRQCLKEFGADRVVTLDFALLQTSPSACATGLLKALSLAPDLPLSVDCDVRRAVSDRRTGLAPFRAFAGRMIRMVSPHLFYRVYHSAVHRASVRKPTVHPITLDETESLYRLLRPDFEREISELEALLGQDLSQWRYDRQIAEIEARMAAPQDARVAAKTDPEAPSPRLA